MSTIRRHRPSPAMVVALVALFVSLGGVGWAAIHLPKNSVGTQQLKNNAVTGAKVKGGSLLARDFKGGHLPRGPQGPTGATGPPGPKGDAGLQGAPGTTDVTAYVKQGNVVANSYGTVESDCPAGSVATGGDARWSSTVDPSFFDSHATPDQATGQFTPTGWEAEIDTGSDMATVWADVLCAAQ